MIDDEARHACTLDIDVSNSSSPVRFFLFLTRLEYVLDWPAKPREDASSQQGQIRQAEMGTYLG